MDPGIEFAVHAAERTAAGVRREMARGLGGLATVSASAAFLGLVLNVWGILTSFRGVDGEKTAIMAFAFGLLGQAMVPTAYGVAIAVAASFAYQILKAQVETFDGEMRAAILDLPRQLRECEAGRKR